MAKSRVAQIHAAFERKFDLDAAKHGGGGTGLDYAVALYVKQVGMGGAFPAYMALSSQLDALDPLEDQERQRTGITVNLIATPVDQAMVTAIEAMLPAAARAFR